MDNTHHKLMCVSAAAVTADGAGKGRPRPGPELEPVGEIRLPLGATISVAIINRLEDDHFGLLVCYSDVCPRLMCRVAVTPERSWSCELGNWFASYGRKYGMPRIVNTQPARGEDRREQGGGEKLRSVENSYLTNKWLEISGC